MQPKEYFHSQHVTCPFGHKRTTSEQATPETTLQPKYYMGAWRILDNKEIGPRNSIIFYRKTDQGVIRETVNFGNLKYTDQFRVELETWACLAFGYGNQVGRRSGPAQLQLLVNELVAYQARLTPQLTFNSLKETFDLVLGKKSGLANISFNGLRFQHILKHLGLPNMFYDLLDFAQALETEKHQIFLESILELNTRIHLSLHSLAQGIIKEVMNAGVHLQKTESDKDFFRLSFTYLGKTFSLGLNKALENSAAENMVIKYFSQVFDLITKISEVTEKPDLITQYISTLASLSGELNTGLNLLIELGFAKLVSCTQELESDRFYSDLGIPEGIFVQKKALSSSSQNVKKDGFGNPHDCSRVHLLLTATYIEIEANVARCPHPYMVPMKIVDR